MSEDSIIGGISVDGMSVAAVVSMSGTGGPRGSTGDAEEGGGGTEIAESVSSTGAGAAGAGAGSSSARGRALASNLCLIMPGVFSYHKQL